MKRLHISYSISGHLWVSKDKEATLVEADDIKRFIDVIYVFDHESF